MNILLSGATGFIGNRVAEVLASDNALRLRGAVRREPADPIAGVEYVQIGDLGPDTAFARAVESIDVVIHAAARVHVTTDSATDPATAFRQVNVRGTINLAEQAARAGVKRFIFISSIKVNGEYTLPGKAFFADDAPAPIDAYGISKHEAEMGLSRVAAATGMEVVIIRPPLVYGPGVKANFLTMMNSINSGIPLPLAGIENKRSLVALDNLAHLIRISMSHPAAANQVFLVSDDDDLSTTELLRRIGKALNVRVRLVAVPRSLLRIAASLAGKEDQARRLLQSLQVDTGKAKRLLGWAPIVTVDEGLEAAARDLRKPVR
jgi:nucleoside-diphosphate-sugar epimerase